MPRKPFSNLEKAALVGIAGALVTGEEVVRRNIRHTERPHVSSLAEAPDETFEVPKHYLPDPGLAETPSPDIKNAVSSDDEMDSEVIKLKEKKKRALFDLTYYYTAEAQQIRAGMTENEIEQLLEERSAEKKARDKDRTQKLLLNLKKLLPGISDIRYERPEDEVNKGFTIYSTRLSGHEPIVFMLPVEQGEWLNGHVFDIYNYDKEIPDSSFSVRVDDYRSIADAIKKFYPELDH